MVGGGDSAVEIACALGDAGARVHLSYRRERLNRPKRVNRERLADAIAAGSVTVVPRSTVSAIRDDTVALSTPNGEMALANQHVFVSIGTRLPTRFLRDLGLRLTSDRDVSHSLVHRPLVHPG